MALPASRDVRVAETKNHWFTVALRLSTTLAMSLAAGTLAAKAIAQYTRPATVAGTNTAPNFKPRVEWPRCFSQNQSRAAATHPDTMASGARTNRLRRRSASPRTDSFLRRAYRRSRVLQPALKVL